MSEWLTIADLADRTDIAESTVRRYLHRFSTFFDTKGGKRYKQYEVTAVRILVRVRELYDLGHESVEVRRILSTEYAMIIDGVSSEIKDEDTQENSVTPALATVEDVAEIKELLKQQQEFNKALLDKLNNQDLYIRESMNKRDALLVESLRTIQEEKRAMLETAASEDKRDEKKPSFFSRFFK